MNKDHLLIYGTIAIDTLIAPTGIADSVLGGSGSFAALAARFITDKAKLIGVVGTDFPADFRHTLESNEVSMQHVDVLDGRSFAWTGRYEDDINIRETVETVLGVEVEWKLELPESLQQPAIAVICNANPHHQLRLIEQCRGAGFIMLDTMKLWLTINPEEVKELLSKVDLALMNEEEAEYFAGTSDSVEAARAILAAGPRYAIIKLGSKGSVLVYNDAAGVEQVITCPAWQLENAIDPTGAGDCYLGALAAYIAEKKLDMSQPQSDQLLSALQCAAPVAARVGEDMGTKSIIDFDKQGLAERMMRFTP